MKEKWTYDLQKKMADYEVPTIPEGLWENIDSALETGVSDKPKEQTTNTQHLTPNTQYWRKVCAAILLLLAIPMTLYLLQEKTPTQNPSPINGEGGEIAYSTPIKEVSTPKAIAQKETETSPTLSSTKRVNRQSTKVSILNVNSEELPQNKAEEPEQNVESTFKEEIPQNSAPALQANNKSEATNREEKSPFMEVEELIKKKPENRLYLAFNASGTNFSSVDSAPELQYASDPTQKGYWAAVYSSSDKITDHDETHHRPIIFGLQVGIPVAEDWSFVTGLTYTYLHSEFKDRTSMGYTLHTDQNLHFIGVPVQMNYQLYNNRYCNIYLGAGGRADFGISGKTDKESHLSNLPVNYSLKAAAGVQVNIFKSLNIYAEPTIQYNIPGSTRYKTYYTEHKTMLDLQFGIRFTP